MLFTALRFFSFALLFRCVGGTAALALSCARAVRTSASSASGVLAERPRPRPRLAFRDRSPGRRPSRVRSGEHIPLERHRPGTRHALRPGLARTGGPAAAWARSPWFCGGEGAGLAARLGSSFASDSVITPAAAGHSELAGALAFVSDVVHVQAGAVWVGGLAFLLLALFLAGPGRWELASPAVPRFSTIAVVSVTALLIAGVINGYLEVRAWSGLWETTYGRLLLAKAALVIPLLPLGLYNNRRSVPRLRAGIASALERRHFLRSVGPSWRS